MIAPSIVNYVSLCLFLMLFGFKFAVGQTVANDDQVDARADSAAFARQLGDLDPRVRQKAAEALARLASVDQRKLVEGYQLQEKNRNVRLALDWALYRMGKSEALFRVVRELNTSRHEQALGYLVQVDGPRVLHPFLRPNNPAKINVGLLEALAQMGDAETLEVIKPFRDSFASGVAEAAEVATDKIEIRLGETQPTKPTRPRTVSKTEQISP
jgi:HEAT repeat protein